MTLHKLLVKWALYAPRKTGYCHCCTWPLNGKILLKAPDTLVVAPRGSSFRLTRNSPCWPDIILPENNMHAAMEE